MDCLETGTLSRKYVRCRSCIDTERRGLLELKAYMISVTNDSDILQEWQTSNHTESDCCHWTEIKCDPTSKRVTGLYLGSFYIPSLEDPFFPTTLLNLALLYPFEELRNLNMSGTGYGGWFGPVQGYKSLGRFKKLEILDLSFNFFNQTILPFLSAATSLKTLLLHHNYIKSGFPELRSLRSLEVLDLKVNRFYGPLPIQELSNMLNLKLLDLSRNHFSGSLQGKWSFFFVANSSQLIFVYALMYLSLCIHQCRNLWNGEFARAHS